MIAYLNCRGATHYTNLTVSIANGAVQDLSAQCAVHWTSCTSRILISEMFSGMGTGWESATHDMGTAGLMARVVEVFYIEVFYLVLESLVRSG